MGYCPNYFAILDLGHRISLGCERMGMGFRFGGLSALYKIFGSSVFFCKMVFYETCVAGRGLGDETMNPLCNTVPSALPPSLSLSLSLST